MTPYESLRELDASDPEWRERKAEALEKKRMDDFLQRERDEKDGDYDALFV